MTRLVWIATTLVLVLSACSESTTAGSEASTSESSLPPQGFAYGSITCEQDGFEQGVADYAEDAVGFASIEEAINAFRQEETWTLREDWQALTPGDISESPVEFLDERGWVYLSVNLVRLNDSWLVNGYESCVPASS